MRRMRVDIMPTPMIPGGDTSIIRDALTTESEELMKDIEALKATQGDVQRRIDSLQRLRGTVMNSIAGLHDNVAYNANKERYEALRSDTLWLEEHKGRWVLVKTGDAPHVYETQQEATWHANWDTDSDQNAYVGYIE